MDCFTVFFDQIKKTSIKNLKKINKSYGHQTFKEYSISKSNLYCGTTLLILHKKLQF